MRDRQVAIIGGGIVGSTAAYYLARQGVEVNLFDLGTGQATKASAGIICPWFSLRRNKPWYYLVSSGAEFYRTLTSDLKEDGFNIEPIFQIDGTLMIRRTAKRVQQDLKQAEEKRKQSPSIGDVHAVEAENVADYFPLVHSEYPATFVEGGGRVDGEALVSTLQEAIQTFGGQIHRCEAFLQRKDDGRIEVYTEHHPARTYDYILASAGAWLPQLLEPLGYTTAIRGQKGQLFSLHHSEWAGQDWPVIMPFGTGDIIPFKDGSIVIGASHEDDMAYDLSIDYDRLNELKEEASQWLPLLESTDIHTVENVKVGTRAMTPDYSVLVGKVPQTENLWAISGLGSSGLTSGPFLGYQFSQKVLRGEWDIQAEDFPIEEYIQLN